VVNKYKNHFKKIKYVIRVFVASLSAVFAAPNVELKMKLEQMEASLLQLTARVLAQLAPFLQIITIMLSRF
jgi:hypothetical protein